MTKGISNYNQGLKSADKNLFATALVGFKNYFETLQTLGNDDKIVLHLLKYNNINSNAVNIYAGYSAMQTEDFSIAEMYFKKIVDLNSTIQIAAEKALPLGYIYYCNMLEKQGNINMAANVIERGMEIFPGNPEVLMTAINLYKNANDIDNLTDVLEKAEGQLPDNYPVLINYANSLLETAGLFEKRGYESTNLNYLLKACEVLNKAIGLNNSEMQLIFLTANTHNNVAKLYFKKSDETNSAKFRDQAEALYLLLLMKKPADKGMLFQIYNNLGAIYYKPAAEIYGLQDKDRIEEYLTLFKKSLPYFEEAHKLQPENRQIMQLLRNLYLIFNEAVKAEEMKTKLGL
jgi:tetratricopeptide (TPR) repeat protein